MWQSESGLKTRWSGAFLMRSWGQPGLLEETLSQKQSG